MNIHKTDLFRAISNTGTTFIYADGKGFDVGSLLCALQRNITAINTGLLGKKRTGELHGTFCEFSDGSRLYKNDIDRCGLFFIDGYACYYAEIIVPLEENECALHKFMCYLVEDETAEYSGSLEMY